VGRRAVSGSTFPARGQIWWADVGLEEKKRFVIVSNNVRNSKLRDVLGARITTANKPDIPSIVCFRAGEVSESECCVVADDIAPLWKTDLTQNIGALTPRQMELVDDALRAALDL
jgi:mRNA-degrading endonuclease toxin of MazEF toxin-antitoxin module